MVFLIDVNTVDLQTHPYLFTLIALCGFGMMAFAFYLIMIQITRRGSAISTMLTDIQEIKAKMAVLESPLPFMKHAEDTFATILHHEGDTSGMDALLDKLKRAPEEPMSMPDRDHLKVLLSERESDTTRSVKERTVARILPDMMDLVLEEAVDEKTK
jgi:hypothetical protein